MDYFSGIYQLYKACAVNGNHQGGWVGIEQNGIVEIVLSAYVSRVIKTERKLDVQEPHNRDSTVANASIAMILLLNHFVYLSMQLTTSNAAQPDCLLRHPQLDSPSCLQLIYQLHDNPDATRYIYWVPYPHDLHVPARAQVSDPAPTLSLPHTLEENPGCIIELDLEEQAYAGDSFRVLDYLESIYAIYAKCVMNGPKQGGYVTVGENEQVEAVIYAEAAALSNKRRPWSVLRGSNETVSNPLRLAKGSPHLDETQ
ncbi:MAG: hypothetical protein Q9217_005674 [Psora testacea]